MTDSNFDDICQNYYSFRVSVSINLVLSDSVNSSMRIKFHCSTGDVQAQPRRSNKLSHVAYEVDIVANSICMNSEVDQVKVQSLAL